MNYTQEYFIMLKESFWFDFTSFPSLSPISSAFPSRNFKIQPVAMLVLVLLLRSYSLSLLVASRPGSRPVMIVDPGGGGGGKTGKEWQHHQQQQE